MDGDARTLVEAGQASFDLSESPYQVDSSPSSLLPLEVPIMSSCFESAAGMEEKGEDVDCSVQGSLVVVQTGLFAEDSGVSIVQLLVNEGGFAPLTELDEDSLDDECGVMGDLDREGHQLASNCVNAMLDAAEVTGDGRESARGGKLTGRGRGGRRGGGSTRGRGGRARGRGRS
ncbi:hypothetical protein Dimus_013493 [Dionaea muscipula]